MDMRSAQSAQPVEFPETPIARKDWNLSLHGEKVYMLGISITRGVPGKIKVNLEDMGLATEVIQALEDAGAIAPKIPVFEQFNALYNRVDGLRKKAQKLMRCSNNVWFLPAGRLIDFNSRVTEMESAAAECRREALTGYEDGYAAFAVAITTILTEAKISADELDNLLSRYLEHFPTREAVAEALQVGLHWYGALEPISTTIKENLDLQIAEAKAEQAEAIALKNHAEAQSAIERVALLEMQARSMASQEQLLQGLQRDVADEISLILAEQRRTIMAVANGKNVTATTHGNCIAATERLETLVGMVQAEKRASIQVQIDAVQSQVKAALEAPRGAFESASIEAEIHSLMADINQGVNPDRVAVLQGRIGILRDVLSRNTQQLDEAIAVLRGEGAKVFDEVAGF